MGTHTESVEPNEFIHCKIYRFGKRVSKSGTYGGRQELFGYEKRESIFFFFTFTVHKNIEVIVHR